MLVPEFWAECRLAGRSADGKPRVVRRFGWSDQSQADAERHAAERAHDAVRRLLAGEAVAQRDRKVAYGWPGLPIREQVLGRRGNDVITRNAFGARCLNEPDVLFADVDVEPTLPPWLGRMRQLALWIYPVAIALGVVVIFREGLLLGCSTMAAGSLLMLVLVLVVELWRRRPANDEGARATARARIERAVAELPGARVALYETPLGYRVLALHKTFDPTGPDTASFFAALGTDPIYARMCALQACFRARVSGKPWRMGIRDNIRPNHGVWPVAQEHRDARDAWIARYEDAARAFAACRHLTDLGNSVVDPRCAAVQRLHDELSGARTDLPLA